MAIHSIAGQLTAFAPPFLSRRSNIGHSRNLETERGPALHSVRRGARSLFDITVGIELFQVGPKVVDLLIVLDAGESHFVPGILAFGSLMYSLKVATFQTMPEFLLASQYW